MAWLAQGTGLPSLDIVLVNRNSGRQLQQCIDSLAATDFSRVSALRVIIVDDASQDASANDLHGGDLPLRILRNDHHCGYGASSNRAARSSAADYVLFLNTDTQVTQDAIATALDFIDDPTNTNVGIVGVQMLDRRGELSRSCSRFPSLGSYFVVVLGLDRIAPRIFWSHKMVEWDHLTTREVDQVIGAFTLIRGALFQQLGGYDERFFVYMEDLDLALRARQAGFKSVYVAEAAVFHSGGGTAAMVPAESLFFNLRSRIQYGFKHFQTLEALALLILTAGIEPATRLVFAVARGSPNAVRVTVEAYARLWRGLPGLIRRNGIVTARDT